MNSAPMESWDGAEAIFTFANSPGVLAVILIASLAVTFGTIILAAVHEKQAYSSHK